MSHTRLLQRILWEGQEAALILEDDALLAPSFSSRLAALLPTLPSDWDVLYLNTCDGIDARNRYHSWGQRAGPLARHLRQATCTVGYLARYTMAAKVLRHVAFRAGGPLDLVYTDMLREGALNGYVADPPLCGWTAQAKNSTVDSAESKRIGKSRGAYSGDGP